jgi:hypothetical protein
MQPDTTIAPDNGPRIPDQAAAHIAGLTPEQRASIRPTYAKAYPHDVERVFGPAPTQPITAQQDGPYIAPADKAKGYVALFKHATDKAGVIAQARRDGVNLQPDGSISDVPVAKESLTEPPKPTPNYRLPWQQRPGLPVEKLVALDAQYREAFGAVELNQTEAGTAFDVIQQTMATVPQDAESRAEFCRREGEALEAAFGEAKAKELVQLHTDWFKRLPEAMQQHLSETFGLHSMRAIVTTAHLQQAWLARRGGK